MKPPEAVTELLKGSTPTLILAVLADGPAHGYAIAREVERRTGDALRLGEGSLYPTLRGMEADGLLSSEWRTEGAGPARRVYTLTEAGTGELAKRTEAWRRFTHAVDAVIGGPGNVPEPA